MRAVQVIGLTVIAVGSAGLAIAQSGRAVADQGATHATTANGDREEAMIRTLQHRIDALQAQVTDLRMQNAVQDQAAQKLRDELAANGRAPAQE